MIRDGGHTHSSGKLYLSEHVQPLLEIISTTFIPLMQQNEAAYCSALSRGQTLFNEAAFNSGEALYDGTLLGRPFRAVVKTFQVAVWRELCVQWDALAESDREYVSHLLPAIADINQSCV
jgi:hypothetical protein